MNAQDSDGNASPMAHIAAPEPEANADDRDEEEAAMQFFRSYRINFSRVHTGRYVPSSKRKISWRFGLANLDALKAGCTGHECRGEENEIILIWSVRSGKTRLFWNNQDISHLIPANKEYVPVSQDVDKSTMREPILRVEFSWTSGSGNLIKVVAHTNPPPSCNQYDLLIDGQPFLALPKASQLGSKEYMRTYLSRKHRPSPSTSSMSELGSQMGMPPYRSNDADSCTSSRKDASRSQGGHRHVEKTTSRQLKGSSSKKGRRPPPPNRGDPLENELSHRLSPDQRDRLAAAGFVSQYDTVDDELQSDFSTALQTLRDDLVVAIPEIEDMMSFAIINAFSDGDREEEMSMSTLGDASRTSTSGSLTGLIINTPPTDVFGIEVDALFQAFDWMKWKANTESPEILHEQKLGLLQREVTELIAHVRRGTLSALEASLIIQGVASLLGLKLASPLPKNTVLLTGLRKDTTKAHLRRALKGFGAIDGVAVASGGPGFGMCRFRSTRAVRLAVDAAYRNEIDIDDVRPQIFELQSPMYPTPVKLITQENGVCKTSPDISCAAGDKKSQEETTSEANFVSHSDHQLSEMNESFDANLSLRSSTERREESSLSPLTAHFRKRTEFDSVSVAAILDDESMAYSDDGVEVYDNAIEVLVKQSSSACTVSTAQSSMGEMENKRDFDEFTNSDESSSLTHILFTPETA